MVSRRTVVGYGGALVSGAVLPGCSMASESGPFEFVTVLFTAEDPGSYDTYDEVPTERTFTAGDYVWTSVVVRNAPTDDETARLAYTFETTAPDGTTWDPVRERDEQWEDVESGDELVVWERFPTFEEDPVGEYEMAITVVDQVDGEQLQATETFELQTES